MKPITVLLMREQPIRRRAPLARLRAAENIRIIGEIQIDRRAVETTRRLLPDVILLDLAMPLLSGLNTTRQITAAIPSARVLVRSGYSRSEVVREAIASGAAGYVLRSTSGSELCQAIHEVHNGQAFFSAPVSRHLLELWRDDVHRPDRTTASGLTHRQVEVLQLIAEGYTSLQIAESLSVAEKTVEKHRQSVMEKLGLHNVASLTRYVLADRGLPRSDHPNRGCHWPSREQPSKERVSKGRARSHGPVRSAASVQPSKEVAQPDGDAPVRFEAMAATRLALTVTWDKPSAAWPKQIRLAAVPG